MRRVFRSLLLLLFTVAAPSLLAQNLVIDGGLEDTLKCPMTIGRFYHPINVNEQYIEFWRATTLASPDLQHTCGYNSFMPRTGEGYAGIILYDPTEYREYITALLASPLQQGVCYYVEFWVALSSGSTLAVDEFQVHFSIGVPLDMSFPPPGPLPLTAHFQAASAPTQTSYQQVCGFYTATGGEDAMTFGNFHDNANTTLTTVSGIGAVQSYYYIDDVTVTQLDLGPDQLICAGDTAQIVPNIQCPDLTYIWSDASSGMSTTATQQGPVSVTISGNGTCSATDAVMINVEPCLGMEEPTGGRIDLSWAGPGRSGTQLFHVSGLTGQDLTAELIDPTGRTLDAHLTQPGPILELDMSSRPSGVYVLIVRGNNIIRSVRFAHEQRR